MVDINNQSNPKIEAILIGSSVRVLVTSTVFNRIVKMTLSVDWIDFYPTNISKIQVTLVSSKDSLSSFS